MLEHEPQSSPYVATLHAFDPDQLRMLKSTEQVDLGFAVAKHVHVGGLVVIDVDDDPEAA